MRTSIPMFSFAALLSISASSSQYSCTSTLTPDPEIEYLKVKTSISILGVVKRMSYEYKTASGEVFQDQASCEYQGSKVTKVCRPEKSESLLHGIVLKGAMFYEFKSTPDVAIMKCNRT